MCIFGGLCIISGLCLNFCATNKVRLWLCCPQVASHKLNFGTATSSYQPLEISIDVVPSSGIGMDNYNYNMHLKPSCIEKVSQILCQENKPCFIALYSTYGILRLFNQSTPVLELFLSLRTVLEFSIFFQSLWSMQKHIFFISWQVLPFVMAGETWRVFNTLSK